MMSQDDNVLLRGQMRVLEMIATGAPLADTLTELALFVEAQEPGMRCGILIVADDGAHFGGVSGPNLPDAYHRALDGVPITPPYLSVCGEAAHRNAAVVASDIANDPRWSDEWRELVLAHGLRAVRSTPVRGVDGRVLASFAMYYDRPRDPHPAHPDLIEIATNLVRIALERTRVAEALEQNEARLRHALDIDTVGVMFWNQDFALTEVNDAFLRMSGFTRDEVMGATWHELTPEEFHPVSEAAIADLAATGRTTPFEKQYFRKDGSRWWGLFAPRRLGQNEVVEYVLDISARKEAQETLRASEERQRLLVRELHHRVKNNLAMVQSLVNLTLRTSASLEDFRAGIGARIGSLARSHELLAEDQWDGAQLERILGGELEPYDDGRRVTLQGPELPLPVAIATPLAMAVHELTTNAVKYGSLSAPAGRLTVTWTAQPVDGGWQLCLDWIESGGPTVEPPSRRGFGATLLERLLSQQLVGTVDVAYPPEGVRVRIEALIPGVAEAMAV